MIKTGDIISNGDLIIIFQSYYHGVEISYYRNGKSYIGIESRVVYNKCDNTLRISTDNNLIRLNEDYKKFSIASNSDTALLLRVLFQKDWYWDEENFNLIKIKY